MSAASVDSRAALLRRWRRPDQGQTTRMPWQWIAGLGQPAPAPVCSVQASDDDRVGHEGQRQCLLVRCSRSPKVGARSLTGPLVEIGFQSSESAVRWHTATRNRKSRINSFYFKGLSGSQTFPFQPTGAPTGAPNAPSSAAAALSQRLGAAAGPGQTGPQARGKGPCRPAPLADPCGGSPTGAPCNWLGGTCPAKKEDFIAARVQRSEK